MDCAKRKNGSEFKKEMHQLIDDNDAIVAQHINTGQGIEAISKLEVLLASHAELEKRDTFGCPILKPIKGTLLYNLGCAHEKICGNVPLAVKYYFEALEFEPDNENALYNLGTNLIKLGRYDEAERFLGRAKELKPYDANYKKNYDQAYRCAVKKDERLRLEYAITYQRLREDAKS